MQTEPKAIVVGAGIGGLATAIRLRQQGYAVELFEAHHRPGGKLNEIQLEGYRFDAGPSLFTLPAEVDDLFQVAGKNPAEHFAYEALDPITRYFYPDGTLIDAFSDPDAFAVEVEEKTGEPRTKVQQWLRHSRKLYDITAHVFLERSLHKLDTYTKWDTIQSILRLPQIDALRTVHRANSKQFGDERVVQLFDRYATYNGSDPYQAPATLNIIPHLEHNIGAYFPHGGMYRITQSVARLAEEVGVQMHLSQPVDQILTEGKRVVGVQVNGEAIPAEIVVSNVDVVPTYRKLLPQLKAPERILKQPRSSSALIFYWGMKSSYPELDVHNLFFSDDYQGEFQTLWQEKSIHPDPTVYLYISAKKCPEDAPQGGENWFVMINVPPNEGQDWDHLMAEARANIQAKLSRMLGKDIASDVVCEDHLDPRRIDSRTSSFQGALYGNSSNNLFAAFLRHPNFHPKVKGLYFVGGSVHPGGGIPLCLHSARIVADLVKKKK